MKKYFNKLGQFKKYGKYCFTCMPGRIKHGMHKTKIYQTWNSMIDRCHKPKSQSYNLYGARGIFVCEHWQKFKNFYSDMGDPPKGKSLDRIDNNGPYSPTNCRWATIEEQNNNRRNTIKLTHNGQTFSLKKWAKQLNINYNTLLSRYQHNWSINKMLTPKSYLGNNQYLSL